MLEAFETEYRRYTEQDESRPMPVSLVMLMEKTHKTILARLGKRGGFNMSELMKNPQQALIHLDRMKENILRMMQQQESMDGPPRSEEHAV